MSRPDPRVTLARPDLAAAELEGVLRAARFEAPIRRVCAAASAPIRDGVGPDAVQQDQLLRGELFDVLETAGGWAWGQARRDGYVGFAPVDALADPGPEPTHRVRALRAYGFSAPDMKAPVLGLYSMNALVAVESDDGRFARTDAGWIALRHLAPIGDWETDPAAVAEAFLGAPYLWGGRESLGLDCSGLIQQALYACGLACPRDADMQGSLGAPVTANALRRGDLVCWPGHIGMMVDATRMIHANGWHMATAIEPLAEMVERTVAAGGTAPTGYRRL